MNGDRDEEWCKLNWEIRNVDRLCTFPETNIAPENGWLEDNPFLLGPGLFSGFFAVSFRDGTFWLCNVTWKINMEPTNHPFRKENDLPNLHDYVPCLFF